MIELRVTPFMVRFLSSFGLGVKVSIAAILLSLSTIAIAQVMGGYGGGAQGINPQMLGGAGAGAFSTRACPAEPTARLFSQCPSL